MRKKKSNPVLFGTEFGIMLRCHPKQSKIDPDDYETSGFNLLG